MCFSMTASFTASAVLGVAGAASLVKAGKGPAKYYAAIPILFGIQQAIEGLQWMNIENTGQASQLLGYAFLFFAFLTWPTYIPFAVAQIEPNAKRKTWLKRLACLGALTSAFLLGVLFSRPMLVQEMGHSIFYNIDVPMTSTIMAIYTFAVCGCGLISTRPWIRAFGFAVFVGFVGTLIVYESTFTSVWCFSAAVLSVLIYAEVRKISRATS